MYEEDVKKADRIRSVNQRKNALETAEKAFDLWMDQYPDTEPNQPLLAAQKKHDAFMDQFRAAHVYFLSNRNTHCAGGRKETPS